MSEGDKEREGWRKELYTSCIYKGERRKGGHNKHYMEGKIVTIVT